VVFNEVVDRRIYFTYNAFEGLSDLPTPGPVFIHQHECEVFASEGFPKDLLQLPIYLEGFSNDAVMLERESMQPEMVNEQITAMLDCQEIAFINLRNAEAGCFIAQVHRRAAAQ
jgi:hypothetical protein